MTGDHIAELDAQRSGRKRVLFIAEAVTLAHAARPVALAASLDPDLYEVHVAWDPRFAHVFDTLPGHTSSLRSISPQRFAAALAKGSPVYDTVTLRDYVRDDLALLDRIKPDAVIGDFRLSLAISAPLAGVPYLTITNAYWSPYLKQQLPLPDLPINRVLGVPVSRALFRMAIPFAFALHAQPLNRVRREHGLPSLGHDLRTIYTWANHTLYADLPALYPDFSRPPNHHFLGAIAWEPTVSLPPWWAELPSDRPTIYVNLGSSGASRLLDIVLLALADLPVFVIAARAGGQSPTVLPANARLADFLPGSVAAAAAGLAVCNGGSPATQQALRAGIPMLALPSNMDQYLNAARVVAAGAARVLRAEQADSSAVRTAVSALLQDDGYAAAARRLADDCAPQVALGRFSMLLADVA